jgi:acyl-CoA thioesterase II
MPGPVSQSFLSLLDLEVVEADVFRASGVAESFSPELFGGQIAAQALWAAARTVPEAMAPHSLHGYFLRPGRIDRPSQLHVTRVRDGRSFSVRRVEVVQGEAALFSAMVSFHRGEAGGEYTEPSLPARPEPELGGEPMVRNSALVIEVASRAPAVDDRGPWLPPRGFWARTREHLPDDPRVHACAVTYISDMGSGFSELDVPDVPPGGASLDHAVWFHRAVRADEWLYSDLGPVSASGARGVYRGHIYDESGRLGATLVQEMLLRPDAPYWKQQRGQPSSGASHQG